MKTKKLIKIWNVAIVSVVFFCTLLLPGALLGAKIPSIEDVVALKAPPPTIEDLTGGRVKNTDLIDKHNVELVKDYLTAAMYEYIKKGMVLKTGTQLPPNQLNPKAFRDATERNRGKAVMNENGAVYYEKIGTFWPGGYPYPWAKTGVEAMGNYNYGRVWDSFSNLPVFIWYINPKGELYKTSGQEHYYIKISGRTTVPPLGTMPGYKDIYVKRLTFATYPLEIKGLGQYSLRYYDSYKEYDTGFAYLPAFKRTLRINASTWQDNVAGSDMIFGDGLAFQEPYSNWDLKLLGKKFLLVHEPKSPVPIIDEKGNVSKNVQFDMGKTFPRLGWIIWPVDVVEAIPKFKHVYGKRIVFIPIYPYIYSISGIAATDIYDKQMKLWKGYIQIFGSHRYLGNDPDKAVTQETGAIMTDLQTGHTTHFWMNNLVNPVLNPDSIALGTMIKLGR